MILINLTSSLSDTDYQNVEMGYMSLVVRKQAFCICENKNADQLRGNREAAKLITAFIFATWIVQSLFYLIRNFKPLAIFCGCTAWFVSDQVGNNEDRFSHNEAHMIRVITTENSLVIRTLLFILSLYQGNKGR